MTSFWTDERAITEVVGALLIIAILISATAIFYAQQLPQWTKEFEYQHAARVPQDFAELGAHIDMALASKEPATPLSTAIGMTPGSVPLVGLKASGGTLTFNPDEETFACIASTLNAENTSDEYWNDTSSWSDFSKYHVRVTEYGATLAPEAGEDKTYNTSTTLPGGEYYFGQFKLINHSILAVQGRLTIHAMDIFIEAGSRITVDGWGYAGGSGNNPGYNGSGIGGGKGGLAGQDIGEGGYGGGGGGCGGTGGNGSENPGSGGSAAHLDDLMGSGGGGGGDWKEPNGKIVLSSGGKGGSGGGYIQLDASNIEIQGTISANGTTGEGGSKTNSNFFGGGGGGGSGGQIIIKGNNVNIAGRLYAVGGNGGNNSLKGTGGGGGGGGEIHVYYDSSLVPGPGDIKTNHINVNYGVGGTSGKKDAEPGQNGTPGSPVVDPARYFPSILYYSTGYLVSNMTAVQGQVGYDTHSTLIRYGNMTYRAALPPDTDIVVKVRTSMYPNMTDAVPWEDCPPVVNGQDISDLPVVSDGHRYIQWRAELLTLDPRITPRLAWVNISYEYGKRPVLVTSSGHVDFASQYLYFTNYQLVYAHGGTIRDQEEGDFMLFAPPLFVGKKGPGISLQITSINLTGDERTLSGRLSATVDASYQDDTLLTNCLNFENISLEITTSYPSAWQHWFNATCGEAGIDYGADPGQYNITTIGNALQVIFYGNETRPVNLWLKRSSAEVEITS
ncbi:MAG: hypothetical protein ACP5E9_08410 [Candidatus Methanospirareceae archaeon]